MLHPIFLYIKNGKEPLWAMEPQQLLLLVFVFSSAVVNTDVLISLQRREQLLCDRAVVDGFSTHL